MENDELNWSAKAFSMLLQQSLGMPDNGKKKVLSLLMDAPDSIKARVTDFDVQQKAGD